jgi:CheY-like chemotaxis protein
MHATRILIIEDDDGSRNALAEILRDEGYEVFATASGKAALGCLAEFKPDFAIIDVHLPDANGIELMQELLTVLPDCGCVVASGSASLTTKDGAPELVDFSGVARTAGALDYLGKPLDVDRLLRTLGGITPA